MSEVANKVKTMLELQDQMNSTVDADWKDLERPWYRAALLELGELIEHYGFKWWKKQTPDMPQVRLEVVDVWHFLLSKVLEDVRKEGDLEVHVEGIVEALNIDEDMAQAFAEHNPENDPRIAAEILMLALLQLQYGGIPVPMQYFTHLLSCAELTFDELFKQYIGKNVLNIFRQKNGYKDGSYVKTWDGKEDNDFLNTLFELTPPADADYVDWLEEQLTEKYKDVVHKFVIAEIREVNALHEKTKG